MIKKTNPVEEVEERGRRGTIKIKKTSKIVTRKQYPTSTPKLKTKEAEVIKTKPLNNERVAQKFPESKPKMKTLKGKIQAALLKAKKG